MNALKSHCSKKTFETIANVLPNGKINLQLPYYISPGKHKIVLIIDEKISSDDSASLIFNTQNPNQKTIETMKKTDAGKELTEYEDVNDFYAEMGI
ncbi:hypothetical protein GMMP15_740045 [Candidatus Magnetomoraceae bacterium gMMP-15]